MPAVVLPSELLKSRLERFTRALGGVAKGDVTSVHRARVASRRLRELVPVLHLPPDAAKKLNRRLRKITTRLGALRELDVMLLLIDELHVSRPRHDAALRRLRLAVVKERDATRKWLDGHLPVDDLRRVGRKLERLRTDLRAAEDADVSVRKPGRAKSTTWATDARITQRAARLGTALTEAGALYLPERLHVVRLAVKKLRYVLELSGEMAAEKATASLRTLKHAQGLLGRMHDLQSLVSRVRDLQSTVAPPSLAAWRDLDALNVTLEDMCRRLHARYVRERGALDAIAERYAAPAAPVGARTDRRRAG
jgi:CHAD domain-containing protein